MYIMDDEEYWTFHLLRTTVISHLKCNQLCVVQINKFRTCTELKLRMRKTCEVSDVMTFRNP